MDTETIFSGKCQFEDMIEKSTENQPPNKATDGKIDVEKLVLIIAHLIFSSIEKYC